jgi:nitrate reductase gamma subunit
MLLSKLLGLYFIIVGVIVLYRRRSIMPAIGQLVSNRPLLLVIALAEILAGLAIILVNPNITPDANGVVALVGWVLAVEGVLYLALPIQTVQRFVRKFNNETWYGTGGAIAILLGGYLAGAAFGII